MAYVENQKKVFKPVKIVLESQDEVDAISALLGLMTEEVVAGSSSIFDALQGFVDIKSKSYRKTRSKIYSALR